MSASVAIMAHPSRRALALALGRKLGAPIAWDTGGGEWETARRALWAYAPGASYHAVIQDDAIPCRHFASALEAVTGAANGLPVGLYVGRERPFAKLVRAAVEAAENAGSPWIEWTGPRWGVGVAFPVSMIGRLVAEADEDREPRYDTRLTNWTRSANLVCRYPLPSLVDHRAELPSLVGSGSGDRRAHRFLGERDPAGIDWSAPAVEVNRTGQLIVPRAV